jgi:hypothetical protein
MLLRPHLPVVALKRKPAARGKRAPHAPSIVEWFSLRPWLVSVANSVAPPTCPLALVAARALRAAIGEDAQNGSTLATIPGELTGVGTAEPWPRCDEEAAAIPCRTVRFTRSMKAVFSRASEAHPL